MVLYLYSWMQHRCYIAIVYCLGKAVLIASVHVQQKHIISSKYIWSGVTRILKMPYAQTWSTINKGVTIKKKNSRRDAITLLQGLAVPSLHSFSLSLAFWLYPFFHLILSLLRTIQREQQISLRVSQNHLSLSLFVQAPFPFFKCKPFYQTFSVLYSSVYPQYRIHKQLWFS